MDRGSFSSHYIFVPLSLMKRLSFQQRINSAPESNSQLTVCVLLYFYALICLSIPKQIPHCTDYWNFLLFIYFVFLGPLPRHMEVPRLGVELELQLPAYAKATATQDLSHVWGLPHSLQQCQILNPLSRAGDWTCILMDTSQVHCGWATVGTPLFSFCFSDWILSIIIKFTASFFSQFIYYFALF